MWRVQRDGSSRKGSFTSLLSSSKSKKNWTQEEDDRLRRLIEEHGVGNWSSIADALTNRTGKQCRERWHNHLQHGIKKGEWTDEEDRILISMQHAIGNQWAEITKHLPGRTDNAVKNRFHATVRAGKSFRDAGMNFVPPPTCTDVETTEATQNFNDSNNNNSSSGGKNSHHNHTNGMMDNSNGAGVDSTSLLMSPMLAASESNDDWMDLAIEPFTIASLSDTFDFNFPVHEGTIDYPCTMHVINDSAPFHVDDDCCFGPKLQHAIIIKNEDEDAEIDESFAEIIVPNNKNSTSGNTPSSSVRGFTLSNVCNW